MTYSVPSPTTIAINDTITFGAVGAPRKTQGRVVEVKRFGFNGLKVRVTLRVLTTANRMGFYDKTFTLRKNNNFVAEGYTMDEGDRFANPTYQLNLTKLVADACGDIIIAAQKVGQSHCMGQSITNRLLQSVNDVIVEQVRRGGHNLGGDIRSIRSEAIARVQMKFGVSDLPGVSADGPTPVERIEQMKTEENIEATETTREAVEALCDYADEKDIMSTLAADLAQVRSDLLSSADERTIEADTILHKRVGAAARKAQKALEMLAAAQAELEVIESLSAIYAKAPKA